MLVATHRALPSIIRGRSITEKGTTRAFSVPRKKLHMLLAVRSAVVGVGAGTTAAAITRLGGSPSSPATQAYVNLERKSGRLAA
jgi:hypothetical protein